MSNPLMASSARREYGRLVAGSRTWNATWIFQGNPANYDVSGAVLALTDLTWTIRQCPRQVRAGDYVYLWECGVNAGIVARGTIATDPAVMTMDSQGARYAVAGAFHGPELRVWIHVDRVIEPRLTRTRFLEHPVLRGLPNISYAAATNYLLTPDMTVALVHEASEPDGRRQRRSAYRRHSEGSSDHSESARAIGTVASSTVGLAEPVLTRGKPWSQHEVALTVQSYLVMLIKELQGHDYSKAYYRSVLSPQLVGRSAAAIEFKHANVSAVLDEQGLTYIRGYKPRGNYQQALALETYRQLDLFPDLVARLRPANATSMSPSKDQVGDQDVR